MAELKRGVGGVMLMLYGLGTTIGAGVFVLIGRVAAESGVYAPFAFVLAACVAGLSAFAFAGLSKRFPEAAGEAAFVREGFNAPRFGAAVGYAIAFAGLISAATIAHGFAGYLARLISAPDVILLVGFAILITAIASWGVTQSVAIAGAITVLEVGVLVVICVLGAPAVLERPETLLGALPPPTIDGWTAALFGGLLAFYAFIGFEDIVNMAEEAKHPGRDMAIAIFGTLIVTTVLYLGVAIVALAAMPVAELAASSAPLADAFARATGFNARPIEVIAVVSVLNGALIQVMKAARVLYGLARNGTAPALLAYVHPRTQTPIVGICIASAIVLILALAFPLDQLARATALITLAAFFLVNIAAARLTVGWRSGIAVAGAAACLGLLAVEVVRRL